jgi:hypothetical protein
MSNWRKVCEAVTEAGEKATARPWACDERRSDIDPQITHPATGDGLGAVYNPDSDGGGFDVPAWRDGAYLVLAANNADRLAAAFKQLAEAWEEHFEYRSCKDFPSELWKAVADA